MGFTAVKDTGLWEEAAQHVAEKTCAPQRKGKLEGEKISIISFHNTTKRLAVYTERAVSGKTVTMSIQVVNEVIFAYILAANCTI